MEGPTNIVLSCIDRFVAARLLALPLLACVACQQFTYAIDRRIYDCGEPFSDVVCALDRFSTQHNYWFGRSEAQPVRGPNPLGPPYSGSTDVDKLYDLAPSVHQYYVDKFGRNGVNGVGGSGTGVDPRFLPSHYGALANSNGSAAGATYCADGMGATAVPSAGYIGVCAGSVDEDTVGHEMFHLVSNPHLVTNSLAGNLPVGETGAISESLSDFFGAALERYATGSFDWLQTEGPGDTVVRNMANPGSLVDPVLGFPFPDRYLSPHFYTGAIDSGGIHHNSTILSKASYLLTAGGSFNGYNIAAIGFDKVEQVLYRALTNYFQPVETFNEAYVDIIQAATDLYPASDVAEVTKALRAVELNLYRGVLSGDYNKDGFIDAADHVIWRKTFGQTGHGLAADGDQSRVIDAGDLTVWRDNFGGFFIGSSSSMLNDPVTSSAVPEPTSVALLIVAMLHSVALRLLVCRPAN